SWDSKERQQEPGAALYWRSSSRIRCHRQQGAFSEQAATHIVIRIQRHTSELRAVDVRNPVVLREPFVDECVIRSQQIENASVFTNDAAEEELGFLPECVAQIIIEIREEIYDRLARLQ